FWFNAVEAEVYGLSMFFVSVILWLGLRWYERADWERSDVYLLFIAYIIGLSVGVHLLAILALFGVELLFYFRRYEFSMNSFVKFGIVAVIVFGVVYPGIVKELPSLLDGEFGGTKSVIFTLIPFAVLLGAIYGVYYSHKTNNRTLNVALLGLLFIVLGYSTYTMVYIRANAKPAMNENDPSNMTRLVSYLNREQYGSAPLIDRRWNVNDDEQRRAHQKYTSDFDYFWRYQLNHMYIRYFGWNYVGAEGDWKEAGVDFKQLYAIPLIIGILGAMYHWRKDWKMAFVATSLFLVLGFILVVYFNMQEPQPRERDYFYVGSFFIFSMWIGMGVLWLVDWLTEAVKGRNPAYSGAIVLVLAFVFVPLNMARTNFHQANRKGNYVAWDYSYNLLQSCDQDAILFTNGDNDTFPLWYLQDVESVRRDIRIVNLSLLNTNWYIRQLKYQEPYGAKKVPISASDEIIEQIQPQRYNPRMVELPVPKEVIEQYNVEGMGGTIQDSTLKKYNKIAFYMPNTLQFGDVKALRAQDIMVYDIIATSAWRRPIYFAMTVADEAKIGLRDYMRLEGMAFRLIPFKGQSYWSNLSEQRMHAHLFTDIEKPSKTMQFGYLWRGLRDSTTYFDEDIRRLMMNYRQSFFLLGLYYANALNQPAKLNEVLDRMEQVVPHKVIPMDYRTKAYVASLYSMAGNNARYKEYSTEMIADLKPIVDRRVAEPFTAENPYVLLLQTYQGLQMYDEAIQLLDVIRAVYSRDDEIVATADTLRARIGREKITASHRDTLASATPQKSAPAATKKGK
ncbi:MAG: DUF2723 domain-containing protein, partial [Ignavibacteriales bacterium]|nr:DUF2723 domain-containing protein [Ignavibacteriales bacterium]